MRTTFSRHLARSRHLAVSGSSLLLFSLIAFGAVAGCDSGQIDGEVDSGEGNAAAGCKVKTSTPLTDEEASSLGFSAEEAMLQVEGHWETTLAWGAQPTTGLVVVSPEPATTTITLDVSPVPGSARLLDLEPTQSGQEGPLLLGPMSCGDELVFDATVAVTSGNGALDDTFEATFVLQTADLAQAAIPLDLSQLNGSFLAEPVSDQPSAKVTQVELSITMAQGVVVGSIRGGVEENDGQAASFAGVTFAEFPADNPCEAGVPLGDDTDLARKAEEVVAALAVFDLTWTGGDTTSLGVTSTLGTGCLGPSGETPVVFPVESSVTSDDGGISNATWYLEAHVTFDGNNDPVRVELLHQAYLAHTFAPGTFASSTGISKIPVDASLEGAFSFSITDDLTDELPASGELTVMEITPADCGSQEPIDSGDGTVAVPGCAGNQVEELGGATFTASSR